MGEGRGKGTVPSSVKKGRIENQDNQFESLCGLRELSPEPVFVCGVCTAIGRKNRLFLLPLRGQTKLDGMASVPSRPDTLTVDPLSEPTADLWARYAMALDEIIDRLQRITSALRSAGVPFALVGGQAVALWVATKDPAAVRTTKDVDLLLRRSDLARARAAARTVEMDYFEAMGVGMFLDRHDPNPRHAVHLVWAGELVRPSDTIVAPDVAERTVLPGDYDVVSLAGLVEMKLMANRDQDRVHLRDLIDVGLVDRGFLPGLPTELATRLVVLLEEQGR